MASLPGLVILADDLTGACDTALQFRSAGASAFVALEGAQPRPMPGAVLACDLDTRDASPEGAYRTTRTAAEHLVRAGLASAYKKVDSTLRGNVGREIDALLDAGLAQAVVLAPAFPAGGRVVRDGCLFVHGIALDATAFVAALPRRSAAVAEIVAATAQSPLATLDLAQVRGGALHAALDAAVGQGARVVVVDAENDHDLDRIAAALTGHPGWLAAGSAGLAEALARRLRGTATSPPRASVAGGPLLAVVGSRNPATLAQLAHMAAQPGVATILVDAEALRGATPEHEIARAAALLAALLGSGSDVLLTPNPAHSDRSDDAAAARAIARGLGRVVARGGALAAGMVITGGSTAAAVLPALGISLLEVTAAVQPGVPALIAHDGRPGLALVTKAGGFGSHDVLAAARDFLRQ